MYFETAGVRLAVALRQLGLGIEQVHLTRAAVLDISKETEETRRLYGLDQPKTAEYGKRCLLARRLVERGVRFVQVFLSGQPWDTHDKNAARLKGLCAMTDGPCAASGR